MTKTWIIELPDGTIIEDSTPFADERMESMRYFERRMERERRREMERRKSDIRYIIGHAIAKRLRKRKGVCG